jgi:TonB family protein
MKTVLAMLLISAAGPVLAAQDQDVQNALSAKYENTVLILRHPDGNGFQLYNRNGELLSSAKPGPWTLDAAVEVKKVRISSDKLRIEGRRRFYAFDTARKQMLPFKMKQGDKPKVKVEISLDASLPTADQAEAIINRVFTRNEADLIDIASEYWRPFLINQYGPPKQNSSGGPPSESLASLSPPKVIDSTQIEVAKLPSPTVRPPKATYTPEPEFSERARNARYQGLVVVSAVVDESGTVKPVAIIRPAGLGLDEQAIAVMKKWRFEPALRDGKPVSVQMSLEIAFRLY